MIYFFTHPRNLLPICTYKKANPYGAGDHIVLVPYGSGSLEEDRVDWTDATCIFSDIELLLPETTFPLATDLYDRVRSGGAKVLNQPGRTMARQPLLEILALEGTNDFRSHRVWDMEDVKFPAFVRSARLHHGSFSPLLHNRRQLERAIVASYLRRRDLRDLLIVEFSDTVGEDGVYRKYGAFVVEGKIIPTHAWFGRHWMVKHPALQDDSTREEELAYVRSNPHEKDLLEVARLAGVEYGRIDYGIVNGRIQVWEINTNPRLAVDAWVGGATDARWDVYDLFQRRLSACFEALDEGSHVIPSSVGSDPMNLCAGWKPKGRVARRASTGLDSLLYLLAAGARPFLMPWARRSARRSENG